MNKTRQEISEFQEKIKPVLTKIIEHTNKNKTHKTYKVIISPCRRLLQKCSCKSYSDMSNLCSLAYWLYIYDYKALALEVCESVRGLDFSEIAGCGLGGITDIFGLEIRIVRELTGEKRRFVIPEDLSDLYFSKRMKRNLRFPEILREDELNVNRFAAFDYTILRALFDMIGKGETGLYTELNENWDKMEAVICEYVGYLKDDT